MIGILEYLSMMGRGNGSVLVPQQLEVSGVHDFDAEKNYKTSQCEAELEDLLKVF